MIAAPRARLPFAALAASLALALPARAQECGRPTSPQGYRGFAYGAAPANSLAGAHVRVWYALSGPHAPDLTSRRPDAVPDNVALAVTVGDGAVESYLRMGFRPPLSDAALAEPCENGGDGLLDVYLVRFTAGADGSTPVETCVENGSIVTCQSFVLLESRLEARPHYGNFDVGVRTVLPHELFHAVQNAYDADFDPYWGEGTAQWAANTLAPELTDLESFLPAFFSDPRHPLDVPPGSVVGNYLYASAAWPLFLSRRQGDAIIREAFEVAAMNGERAAPTVDAALALHGSSLAVEFPLFTTWNAATGSRADPTGYPDAASYPEVPTEPLAAGESKADVLAGLSSVYYAFRADTRHRVTFAPADPNRLAARLLPLDEAGKVRIADARELPAEIEGNAIIVVAGKSALKTDAPFVIASEAAPATPPTDSPSEGGEEGGEGCALTPTSPRPRQSARLSVFALVGLALGVARRRRTVERRSDGLSHSTAFGSWRRSLAGRRDGQVCLEHGWWPVRPRSRLLRVPRFGAVDEGGAGLRRV